MSYLLSWIKASRASSTYPTLLLVARDYGEGSGSRRQEAVSGEDSVRDEGEEEEEDDMVDASELAFHSEIPRRLKCASFI